MSEPVKPKNAGQYLEILRSTTPDWYHQPLFANLEANAMYRAMARTQAGLASRGYQVAQAQFLRTHSTAGAPPASSWAEASAPVILRRSYDLGAARYITAGAMILTGPSGRTYWNYESIYWPPGDTEERTATFVCTVPGVVGNLAHLADDGGLITRESTSDDQSVINDEVDLDIISLADLSEGRTGVDASIVTGESYASGSLLRDSGKPDQFSATNRDIYVRIDDAANPENIGRTLRILSVRFPGVEHPPNSGLYPHELEVDDLPLFVPVYAKQDDGGVFTDYTAAAADDTADDVELLPDPQTVGDAFYLGADDAFLGVAIALTTPASGEYQLAWEYWDGVAWLPYPGIQDQTQGFILPGDLRIEAPTLPFVWTQSTIDGVTAYWLRARVVSVGASGTAPRASKIVALKPDRLTPETGTIQWSVLDWKDLGIKLVQVSAFSGGRDNTLGMIGEERGVERQKNEDDEAYRARLGNLDDVVSPNAIKRIVSRALAPYGLGAIVQDAANGMTGLFCDIDALDYYGPGDIHPIDKHKLLYTNAMAYGGFEVIVPYLSDGEYGMACDEGPVLYLEPLQTFLGPACDCGFLDGSTPIKADQVYAALYAQILDARAYPTTFIMFRDVTQNIPAC